MTRFTNSAIDPRRLTCLPHRIAGMTPARREFVHGKIVPLHSPRDGFQRFVAWVAMGVIVVAFLFFGASA